MILAHIKFLEGSFYKADYLVTIFFDADKIGDKVVSGFMDFKVVSGFMDFKFHVSTVGIEVVTWDDDFYPYRSYMKKEQFDRIIEIHNKKFPRRREGE